MLTKQLSINLSLAFAGMASLKTQKLGKTENLKDKIIPDIIST